MTNWLVTIVGPTAIGKTALAIELAKHFKTEILSGDSRQFYKEMSIGTAVPSAKELEAAPHHFIQHLSIEDNYSVGHFEKDTIALLKNIFEKQPLAILVGGSGMYVDAVINGLDEFPRVKPVIRDELNKLYTSNGLGALHKLLEQKDPIYYNKVDLQNHQRIIRALEVCISSGKPFSSFQQKKKPPRNFNVIKIGLNADRAILYDRINKRVDHMITVGLVEEVKNLLPRKRLNALQTVGYRELFAHFESEYTLKEAIEKIKTNTRRFAKRQLTWYRKDEDIKWFDFQTNVTEIIEFIKTKTS